MLAIALVACAPARSSFAQTFERPWLDWRTLRTDHFAIHYPRHLEEWSRFVASRIEAVHGSVTELVGFTPPVRVNIVVEDPFNLSNGFAFPFVRAPVIVFWATPPDPRDAIGEFRSWGEMLAVHEFAHVAHLARPSRNPLRRALWAALPVNLGPISLRAPTWVIEGYATYVEGRVTGSGRPNGFWRPAILRTWALEGRLPSYAQLNGSGDYEGGSFAYLAGSAFLEWLVRREGDSTLVHMWRRLTARRVRSFDEAFRGVYGDSPRDLYGRFTAELTARSVDAKRALEAEGMVDGELIQHLSWGTGDPAISRDGAHAALVLRSNQRPPRVVVWGTAPEPDTVEARERAKLLKADPLDVPSRRFYPTPKRALATLVARNGRAFEDPRWMPDGRHLLLWRYVRRADGALRPELYVWEVERPGKNGSNTVGNFGVRRVTRGAAVREADPSPDGRGAVALQCVTGHCDVVHVDLSTGKVRTLAAGDARTSYYRPRFSPDGRTIAVSVHRENRWRIALLDADGRQTGFADPDDGADRFDADWLDAKALVAVSDRSGTANLERLDLGATPSARPLTRVIGAAFAPVRNPADSSIWFLSLHSHGFDVRRLPAGGGRPELTEEQAVLRDQRFFPATIAAPVPLRTFPDATLPTSRPYGLGPRTTRWLPTGVGGADGFSAGLALTNVDVVGRLSIQGRGLLGTPSAWRGGALAGVWRGTRPFVTGELFLALQEPVENFPPSPDSAALAALDSQLGGGVLRLDYQNDFDRGSVRVGAGGSLESLRRITPLQDSTGARQLGFVELGLTARQNIEGTLIGEWLGANFSAGTTALGDLRPGFGRTLVSAKLAVGTADLLPVAVMGTYGHLSNGAAPFEQFSLGGLPSTLIDSSVITQRITLPALPAGVSTGNRALALRGEVPLGLLVPYYWTASARVGDGRFSRWNRVLGVDIAFEAPPISVIGLPGGRLSAGVAYSYDEPFAHKTQLYGTIALRP